VVGVHVVLRTEEQQPGQARAERSSDDERFAAALLRVALDLIHQLAAAARVARDEDALVCRDSQRVVRYHGDDDHREADELLVLIRGEALTQSVRLEVLIDIEPWRGLADQSIAALASVLGDKSRAGGIVKDLASSALSNPGLHILPLICAYGS